MPSCPTFSEESFTSSLNSPRTDENSWDKMPSCPTFSAGEMDQRILTITLLAALSVHHHGDLHITASDQGAGREDVGLFEADQVALSPGECDLEHPRPRSSHSPRRARYAF